MSARIHDLLEIDVERFLQANVWGPTRHASGPQPRAPASGSTHASVPAPAWVAEILRQTPFVVVRRGPISNNEIPVGIRGTHRNERYPATCHPTLVGGILTPQRLLARAQATSTRSSRRTSDIPALQALALLTERWNTLELPWGPAGSVGFELATGRPTATSQSDLDVVIYADTPMTIAEARHLRDDAQGLPAPVDIRVETPTCGFSLHEYASRSPAPILLRTVSGDAVLAADPWAAAPDATRADRPPVTCADGPLAANAAEDRR